MPVRIVIADDHALVRQGFRALLAAVPDFEVVGEAANGREALRVIRTLVPEVALMDISMPEMNGMDATALALRQHPNLKVIIVSMHATEAYVLEALRAGAAGYLLKDADAGDLERAIRTVVRGERFLTPSVSHHLIDRFIRAERGEQTPLADALTPRQREVLQLVAEGRSTREISLRLHLSVKTIETHRAHLMERLQIFDVAGLTRYALRIGLVDPES
jgi:DNA-binding NarL/FixJ family response regulator